MDVFVAICFYPPDHLSLPVLMKVSTEIKESSYFVYGDVCLMCCLPLWLLISENMVEIRVVRKGCTVTVCLAQAINLMGAHAEPHEEQ